METSRRDVFSRRDDNNRCFLSICLGTGMLSLIWLWQGLHGVSSISGLHGVSSISGLHGVSSMAGMPYTYSLCEIDVGLAPNSLWISPGHSTTTSDSVVPSRCVHACVLSHYSCVRLFGTLWTGVHQAPLSMGFSMQEYWSGLPCPPPGALPYSGINPASFTSPALTSVFFTISTIWEFYTPIVFSHQSHGIQRLLVN